MYRDRGEPRRFAPVKEGDELDVKIEAVGEKGDGIAKKQGFVLFVPKTKTGDEVRIRVTKVLKSAGFAEVIGQATSAPAPSTPQRPKEEEFNPNTEADSENFGDDAEAEEVAEKSDDDAEAEEVAEKSDDDADENAEKAQED
jgi:predicted RNA-binding protein with TRAM domain